MSEELPNINQEDFGGKETKDLPVKRGHAPKGITDKVRDASMAQKRYDVWKYYVNGTTQFRELAKKAGVSRSTAQRWIKGDLKRIAQDRDDLTENFLEVELVRLDTLLELLMRDVGRKLIDVWEPREIEVKSGEGKSYTKTVSEKTTHLLERVDVDIVDRILKVQKAREGYLALNAPRQDSKDDKSDFDLEELCKAAKLLAEGKMPKEFIDAEFTPEKKGNDEEEGQEKETGDQEEESYVLDESFQKDPEETQGPE